MNRIRPVIVRYRYSILAAAGFILFGVVFWDRLAAFYGFLTDREGIKGFVASFGAAAPLVFIALQVLQVAFAPVPGELSGLIGGYLFGGALGFIYSSIGLALGSALNFGIGRLLGERFIHRLIPEERWRRLDTFLTHQGVLVLFFCFAFPGFPKDYLCLFLGLTGLPFKVFILLAAVGRMPGTLMLSIQGSLLYSRMYGVYALVLGLCLVLVLIAYLYRFRIYRWIERLNGK
jgi:uncharacterized membrane protein YdjX (TVP38/TMEM64 family)